MQAKKVIIHFLTLLCVGFSTMAAAWSDDWPDCDIAKINSPRPDPQQILNLSLDEAILLAVRGNPNVQSTKLSYVAQKFNLWVQEWQFLPQYSLTATSTLTRTGIPGQPIQNSQNYTVSPGASILTPIGTTISVTGNLVKTTNFNPGLSVQISQPLMRGFGRAIVEAALHNAQDSAFISRLGIEGILRSTVSGVINAYLDVVSAEKTVEINQEALKRAQLSVQQTKLYIKAGHKAGNEIVTVEADVASAQSQLVNSKNNLLQAKFALLAAIGVDPNSNVRFSTLNVHKLIKKYRLPPLEETKLLTLANDIQFQTDKITLHGPTRRALMIAEDNTRWQLNLTATDNFGGGSGGGQSAGWNSLFNGANQGQSVQLQLSIPINDQLTKQAVVNAKVSLKQAELALMQERWNKETSAINGWNLVESAQRALRFAENAERLQEKTYNINYQKYLHGLIDSLALQQAQLQLIQSQQALLSAQISYVKSLVNLDMLIGHTLITWDVQVRI